MNHISDDSNDVLEFDSLGRNGWPEWLVDDLTLGALREVQCNGDPEDFFAVADLKASVDKVIEDLHGKEVDNHTANRLKQAVRVVLTSFLVYTTDAQHPRTRLVVEANYASKD